MARRIPAGGRSSSAPIRIGPTPIGDNSAAGEESERVQLISIVSQLSSAEDAVETAKAPLKAAQKKRSQIIGLGKAAGFTAKELSARLDEMRTGTRDMAEREAREHKHRRWLGIIEPDQSKLILGDQAPQEIKDEAHWKGEGYKAGLRQMAPKPPPECGERFVQAWLAEHSRGLKEVTLANVPGGKAISEQAKADFMADNPEVDLDAAARKLKKNPEFMSRDGPDAGTPPELVDQPFEATAEELAGQTTRRAIQEARVGEALEEEPTEEIV